MKAYIKGIYRHFKFYTRQSSISNRSILKAYNPKLKEYYTWNINERFYAANFDPEKCIKLLCKYLVNKYD